MMFNINYLTVLKWPGMASFGKVHVIDKWYYFKTLREVGTFFNLIPVPFNNSNSQSIQDGRTALRQAQDRPLHFLADESGGFNDVRFFGWCFRAVDEPLFSIRGVIKAKGDDFHGKSGVHMLC